MAVLSHRFLVCSVPADRRCIEGIVPTGNAPAGFEFVTIRSDDARAPDGFWSDPSGFYLTAGPSFEIKPLSENSREDSLRAKAGDALAVEVVQIRPAIDVLIGGQPSNKRVRVYNWLDGRISAVRNIFAGDAYSDAFRLGALQSLADGPTEIGRRNSTPLIKRIGQFAKVVESATQDPVGARLFWSATGQRTNFAGAVQYGAAETDLAILWDVENWTVGRNAGG